MTLYFSKSTGSYCSAYGCSNNKRDHPGKSFFRFPKHKERCQIWVDCSQREDLQQRDVDYLYSNCRLCTDHFEDDMFMNPDKKKLVWNAVPKLLSAADTSTIPPKKHRLSPEPAQSKQPQDLADHGMGLDHATVSVDQPSDEQPTPVTDQQKPLPNTMDHPYLIALANAMRANSSPGSDSSSNFREGHAGGETTGDNLLWGNALNLNPLHPVLNTYTRALMLRNAIHLNSLMAKQAICNAISSAAKKSENSVCVDSDGAKGSSVTNKDTIYLNGDVSLTPIKTESEEVDETEDLSSDPLQVNQKDMVFISRSESDSSTATGIRGLNSSLAKTSNEDESSSNSTFTANPLRFGNDEKEVVVDRNTSDTVKDENPPILNPLSLYNNDSSKLSEFLTRLIAARSLSAQSAETSSEQVPKSNFSSSVLESSSIFSKSPLISQSSELASSSGTKGYIPRRKFECSFCGKKYRSQEELRRHEDLHDGNKNFPCKVCGKEFTRENSLVTHSRIHSEEKAYTCDICGKGFYWKSCLTRHMSIHEDQKDYTCHICGKVFFNKSYIAAHIAGVHTKEKKYKCNICDKAFSFEASLIKHKDTHLNGKNYSCNTCGKMFSKLCDLTVHRIEHTEMDMPKSEEMEDNFPSVETAISSFISARSKNILSAGEQDSSSSETGNIDPLVTDSNVLKCNNAQGISHPDGLSSDTMSEFKVKDEVKGEINISSVVSTALSGTSNAEDFSLSCNSLITSNESKPLDNSFSSNNLSDFDNWKNDLKVDLLQLEHSREKSFACNICGKVFSRRYNLKTHKRTHSAEKSFKCKICGKGFYWKSCLTRHFEVHMDKENFSCPICGKVFFNKSYVKGHMVVHTGEKKFKCVICGKAFAFNVSLRKHMARHTDQEKFECGKESMQMTSSKPTTRMYCCDLCGQSFTSKKVLSSHMEMHLQAGEFHCNLCDLSFGSEILLERHIASHVAGEEVKSYECQLCDKKFGEEFELSLHKAEHEGDKDYACEICGQSYNHKLSLVQHMVVHSSDKKCSICGETFAFESHLIQHIALHTVGTNSKTGDIYPAKDSSSTGGNKADGVNNEGDPSVVIKEEPGIAVVIKEEPNVEFVDCSDRTENDISETGLQEDMEGIIEGN